MRVCARQRTNHFRGLWAFWFLLCLLAGRPGGGVHGARQEQSAILTTDDSEATDCFRCRRKPKRQ